MKEVWKNILNLKHFKFVILKRFKDQDTSLIDNNYKQPTFVSKKSLLKLINAAIEDVKR